MGMKYGLPAGTALALSRPANLVCAQRDIGGTDIPGKLFDSACTNDWKRAFG